MSLASSALTSDIRRTAFKSPLRYPGGKQKAIVQIAALLPARAEEYREPMVGGGSVYFHARSVELAQRYWINDQFTELVAFWKQTQNRRTCKRLQKELEWLRSHFRDADEIKDYFLKARTEEVSNEFRMAFLFFFFNRVTFSGTTRAGGFSSAASTARFTQSSIDRLGNLPEALAGTEITNTDFSEVITRPGRDVFIFIDPPYFTAQRLYGKNGSLHSFDHERLANLLKKTPHRFLITYDDCTEIRKLYKWAKVSSWQLQYGMNNCSKNNESKVGSEVFIRNY